MILMRITSIILLALFILATYLFAPPTPRFWIVPCCGIYKRNSKGAYDRYVLWPVGRCVDDPRYCGNKGDLPK